MGTGPPLLPYDEISTRIAGITGKAPISLFLFSFLLLRGRRVIRGEVDVPCDEPDFQEQEKEARQIHQMLFHHGRFLVLAFSH